ncbi:MAG: pentapeptide repeat-containing protein [Solirubrobacteraceae bacterium]
MTAGATIPGIEEWRRKLRALEDCPWPGPKPFGRTTPPDLLVGRDEDSRIFLREVAEPSHRLIFLTGDSGVGKSSLLTARLIPDLSVAGFTVAVCRDWSGSDADVAAAPFLASKIQQALAASGTVRKARDSSGADVPFSSGVDLFWELSQDLGGDAVIVLDQFEELLRYAPKLRGELFDLLLEINNKLQVKIVISFRRDFLLDLQWLEERSKPFSFSQRVLKHVPRLDEEGHSNARNLCLAPNAIAAAPVITQDAASLIAELWDDAQPTSRGGDHADPLYGLGMLQLQALLFALHAKAGSGRLIERDIVKEFMRDENDVECSAEELFLKALRSSIDVKLERSVAAASAMDRYLVEGTTQAVARTTPHLSSAGFKLEREARDLGERALGPELSILLSSLGVSDVPEAQFAALFTVVIEASRPLVRDNDDDGATDTPSPSPPPLTRAQIAALADERLGEDFWRPRVSASTEDAPADPKDVTSGPAMGLAPAAVLIEEVRRFAFALAWLEETALVRLSSPGSGNLIVSLIHDGFDQALQTWSRGRIDEAQGALHALTAPRGAAFEWREGRASQGAGVNALTDDDVRVVANLRWRGAGVSAHFKTVVFLNCDFRGAYFFGCKFDGVTFVNCMLEGVVFVNCVLTPAAQGSAEFRPAARPRESEEQPFVEPVFVVRDLVGADADAVAPHMSYRDLGGKASGFLSTSPERPALPLLKDHPQSTAWTPHVGGVAIYGSRVSSMVVRDSRGDLTLRHSSGSGLDVLFHDGGAFELFDCTMRHIRFTAKQHATPITLTATDCVLSQVWMSEDLRGSFVVHGGTLVQAWNQSREQSFSARATAAKVYGTVGVTLENCTGLEDFEHDLAGHEGVIDADLRLFAATRAMDYRPDRGPVYPRR